MNTKTIGTVLVLLATFMASCARETEQNQYLTGFTDEENRYLAAFTDEFLAEQVVPQTLDIAERAVAGLPLSTKVLKQRRITLIEVNIEGESKIVYEDASLRPPYSAMMTVLPNAQLAGIYIPKELGSPIVELRMNHQIGTNGFAAVHIVTKRPKKSSLQNAPRKRGPFCD